jgi:hypothetical protein
MNTTKDHCFQDAIHCTNITEDFRDKGELTILYLGRIFTEVCARSAILFALGFRSEEARRFFGI